jgi:hypothetical protein
VAVKFALKAVRVAHATAHLPHAAAVLRKAHGVIVKIVPKEVLTVRHPIDSTIAMTATTTDATTAAHGATSCHVTLIPSWPTNLHVKVHLVATAVAAVVNLIPHAPVSTAWLAVGAVVLAVMVAAVGVDLAVVVAAEVVALVAAVAMVAATVVAVRSVAD